MADTIFGMPLDQAQSKYGNATGSNWSFSDFIPNVYGGVASGFEGILGNQQAQQLGQRANIGGLLGAAAALAQGMSKQGPRRSGLQNVLGALGAGYGASGQAYQGGIEQMANAQKLAQMKLQMQPRF